MSDERIFDPGNVSTKAEDYHGSARYERILPNLVAQGVNAVNLEISFEEALKLSLALQSCLTQLNRYHRGTIAGREMGLLLFVNTEGTSVAVMEKRITPEE